MAKKEFCFDAGNRFENLEAYLAVFSERAPIENKDATIIALKNALARKDAEIAELKARIEALEAKE